MYCMLPMPSAMDAEMSGTPTGSGMQVQPPGIQLGIPWMRETMGPG